MNQKIILTKGISGSGKSTWALGMVQQLPTVYRRVNKDTIREMLGNDLMDKPTKYENLVVEMRDRAIDMLLSQGYSVIVDDTNLHPKHEKHIRDLFGHRADIEIKMFHVDLAEAIDRDLHRHKSVGERVIREQYKQLIRDNSPEVKVVEYNPRLSDAIICDLDGTLCIMNDRNPYDASTCENDAPNPPVVHVVEMYAPTHVIIFLSGREDSSREPTMRWLNKYVNISDYQLFMRPAGDNRKDSIVKEEMYNEFVKGIFNVRFVLDDRRQVVSLWRSLGLTCFQVDWGEF